MAYLRGVLLLALLLLGNWGFAQVEYQPRSYQVDLSGEGVDFQPYWNGTGFTPGNLLFRRDMQLTLDYQAAIANQGMHYVRPHWLLNLVTVRHPGSKEAEYDFKRLLGALDEMIHRGMKPVFEIMGFPRIVDADDIRYDADAQGQRGERQQWIPDFEQREDYLLWYDFVQQLITALEQHYGSKELKTWFFESTNEPDIHEWFWQQGIPALLNYWDATSEAIKSVNPHYVFGGPGTATVLSDEFKAVLAHCDTGTNAITGEQGAVLDFISVHAKNLPYDMIDMEKRSIDYIREHHPAFTDIPFWNNEADPTWGWRRPFWWRPTPWYAAFIVQAVDTHNRLIIDALDINYGLLINDKGFLGDWYTRTALARFADPDNKDHFWLIKKPVHNAMSLLAQMGGRRYHARGYSDQRELTTVIPVRKDNGQVVILIANMPEFGPVRSGADSDAVITPEQRRRHDSHGAMVDLQLAGLNIRNPVMSHVRIDTIHSNPYAVWRDIGSPERLDADDYALLAAHMEPTIISQRRPLENSQDPLQLRMSPSSLSMLVISEADSAQDSAQDSQESHPSLRSVSRYRGMNGERKAFVRWEQAGEGVIAYNIYASPDGENYQRINPTPVFDLGFVHVLPEDMDQDFSYRVRVVDL